jgi:general nucleoside transport system ATP-binding protein
MSRRPRTPQGAFSVEALNVTMRFGEFTALDDVSMKIEAGSFHALLGENGAGKSTIVKAIMGFYRATSGTVLVAGREVEMTDPKVAQGLGLGMVYQHFTLVPSLTAAENLVISRADAPAVINWRTERAALEAFMARMPFAVPLDQPCAPAGGGGKAEARNPQAALPRAPLSDPRRADLGPDTRRGRRGVGSRPRLDPRGRSDAC